MKTAKKSAVVAINVQCPYCGEDCVDTQTGALVITEEDETVECISCGKQSRVPMTAFGYKRGVKR